MPRRLMATIVAGLAVVSGVGAAWGGSAGPRGSIVFARSKVEHGGATNVYVVHADGTGAARLLIRNADAPAVSSKGAIAFVRGRALWLAGPDGKNQRQLTHPPGSSLGGDGEPAWSPDGRRIYFTRAEDKFGDTGLFAVESDGGGVRRIDEARPTDHVNCDERPSVSPDGARVAFAQTGDCEHGLFGIVGVTRDGKPTRLPFRWPASGDTLLESDPAWARDGRLAYVTIDYDAESNPPFGVGKGGLWISRPDGSAAQRVVKSDDVEYPAWSPDGRWLAYSGTQSAGLYVVAADGTNRHRLRTLRGYLRYANWLP